MPGFTITRRVEFGDTDMAGIVHFSNFFRYMEVAETSFLNSLGVSVTWLHEGRRYGFPRVSVACDFQKPAFFGDELQITISVVKVGTTSVSYRYDFHRNGEHLATGRMTSVHCLKAETGFGMESKPIPEELRAKLLEYLTE